MERTPVENNPSSEVTKRNEGGVLGKRLETENNKGAIARTATGTTLRCIKSEGGDWRTTHLEREKDSVGALGKNDDTGGSANALGSDAKYVANDLEANLIPQCCP